MARPGALNVYAPNQNDPNFSTRFIEPTLNVNPVNLGSVSCTGYRCLNVIGGGSFKIQASSLINGQQLLIINTSGSQSVSISLDNGGLVAGVAS